MRPLLTIVFCFWFFPMTQAAEQAFPKTGIGEIEVKVLPAATLAASSGEADYFERSDSLFRPLFRYIQSNDIAMTTPVEAEVQPGVMYFYIGGDAADRDLPETDEVKIHQLPERMVLSIGLLGSYSAKNFARGEARLCEWIMPDKLQGNGCGARNLLERPFHPAGAETLGSPYSGSFGRVGIQTKSLQLRAVIVDNPACVYELPSTENRS